MSLKKSIGWTDKTINPIKGICRGGCWYCWTKPLYKRKFLHPELRLNLDVFFKLPKSPKKIFLCSTHDMFGSWIPEVWRRNIFYAINNYPQHTFQILTKFPQNIDREMPDNVWLGCTVTKGDDEGWMRLYYLKEAKAKLKFVSFEPLLRRLNHPIIVNAGEFDWFIFGKLTQHGKKYDPKKTWLKFPIDYLKGVKRKPIFLKDNLKGIYEPLIQEMPE